MADAGAVVSVVLPYELMSLLGFNWVKSHKDSMFSNCCVCIAPLSLVGLDVEDIDPDLVMSMLYW